MAALKYCREIVKPKEQLRKRKSLFLADLANTKKQNSVWLINFADIEITEIPKLKNSTNSQENGNNTKPTLAGEKDEVASISSQNEL